eukprot:CAMPEP_0117439446 /NCGR_PEP_ID=MMETSP0759-20121206/2569_1 /TAXON_ID=63605 /ORGANISM="Percolomonas cosmopolitus, Strain WS" /LENGTH=122 /DNA_ID=CAMNT_0005231161 /DNA_START=166 /DNA_END=534 /DNA_ORIENTATION=-
MNTTIFKVRATDYKQSLSIYSLNLEMDENCTSISDCHALVDNYAATGVANASENSYWYNSVYNYEARTLSFDMSKGWMQDTKRYFFHLHENQLDTNMFDPFAYSFSCMYEEYGVKCAIRVRQ